MPDSGLRLRLILGKFRVVQISQAILGPGKFLKIELADGYQLDCGPLPDMADVRPGDLITFYGEVPTNAPTVPTSKQ